MKYRLTLLGGLIALVGMLALASPASAAPQAPAARPTEAITASIPCTVDGVASTCQLNVTSFEVVNDTLTAVGTVTSGTTSVPFQAPVQATGSCQVLDLVLGPLHLDLLGLVVDLNQVHLTITAEQGPGNLLGNLLCAVTHLLDNSSSTTSLQQIGNLLNQILGAV